MAISPVASTALDNSLIGARNGFAVTPDDDDPLTNPDTSLPIVSKGVLLGTAGVLAVVYPDGSQDIITGLAAGVIHPLQVIGILATGTAATDIHVFY